VTIAWVVGSHGLLGSALCRALHRDGTEIFSPAERFRWGDDAVLASQMAAAVEAFATRAASSRRWEIYWAAGVGTMSSTDAALESETHAISALLHAVASSPLGGKPGALAFASSAGAIYAGSRDDVITEQTPPAPTTAYARAKLAQEVLIREFAQAHASVSALLARISTVYGAGQSRGKPQGLLTHIARCVLRNLPIQIYVPFDTIRDYIASDDAAVAMISALRSTADAARTRMKIIASGQPVTIAEIVATFRRVTRRAPRVITSASKLSDIYSRRMQFQSRQAHGEAPPPKTSLLIGIAQVMAAERAALSRGWRSEGR
jgi:UDP-glucose 4-epimerase